MWLNSVYFFSGFLLGAITVTNSELFWELLGKDLLLVVSSLSLPISFLVFLRGQTAKKVVFNKIFLSFALIFLLVTSFVLLYNLNNEVFTSYYFRAIYSVCLLGLLSMCSSESKRICFYTFGYFISVLIFAVIVLFLQGETDSVGNILCLLCMVCYLHWVFSSKLNKALPIGILGFVIFVSFILVARTATALALIVLIFILIEPYFKNKGASFKVYKSISILSIIFLYSVVFYIAAFEYQNVILNELLTYRPILWHGSLAGLELSDSLLIPNDYLFDIGYFSGQDVYSYHGWNKDDIKSYSAHSFLFANINRWGAAGTALMFLVLFSFWCKVQSYSLFSLITLVLINGAFSTVILGTNNMYGAFMLVILVLFNDKEQLK